MALIKTKYRYNVVNYANEESYDDAFVLWLYDWKNTNYSFEDDWDRESLAKECASHYFNCNEGWDHRSWTNGNEPLTFIIWFSESVSFSYEVYMEYEPSFNVRKI